MEHAAGPGGVLGRSPSAVAAGALVGLVLGIPLVTAVQPGGGGAGDLLVAFVVPVVLSLVAAAAGSGLVGSWAAAVPYSVVALTTGSCSDGAVCAGPPTVLEALPVAVLLAVVPGLVGYGLVVAGTRVRPSASRWRVVAALVAGVVILTPLAVWVAGRVAWHPIIDPVMDTLVDPTLDLLGI